jgi:3'-5' exonuclease
MPDSIIVWDIETVPDLKGFAAANDLEGKSDNEVREVIGDKFPKLIFHSIVCIGALIAERHDSVWHVRVTGAPHIGERTEKELIEGFVGKIAELEPQLITFNGSNFDLPVLRYRAMVHQVAAPGLSARPYFNRYTDDALDLCDVLASFSSRARGTLHEICRVLGLPGKGEGISGAMVENYYREGRVKEIAEYCETDVINTYRVWLRYQLFRGGVTLEQFKASERDLGTHIRERIASKPHLVGFSDCEIGDMVRTDDLTYETVPRQSEDRSSS